ncbi:MAG: 2Fe-2S iron-sulfur cluster-binding protein [Pseudolysinimonas sp.]
MNDPHIWWYVTRTSAILAWTLMTLSVTWGVLLSTRVLRKVADSSRLQDLHRYFGGVALLMVVLHMVSLVLDQWAHFSIVELLVPLQSSYRPIPVAIGILAVYLLAAVYGSSLLRDRLPPKFWKGLHYTSYATVLAVAFHAGLAGSDVGRWWYVSLSTALISLTAVSVIVRLIMTSRAPAALPVAPAVDVATGYEGELADAVGRLAARRAINAQAGPTLATTVLDRAPDWTTAAAAMVVVDVHDAADGVRALRLLPLGGGDLPRWEPGAHLTIELPTGQTRQYSLCGDPAVRSHYDIAVLRDSLSRGGSAWIHDGLRPGMTLQVWAPRNHFPLVAAHDYLFVAGGIGITPLRSMLDSLPSRRSWRLLYLGRSRTTMAFLPDLLARHPERVFAYARDEHPARADVPAAIAQLTNATTEVFCCGPEELIDAVRAATSPERFHAEHFVPVVRTHVGAAKELTVDCVRSGIEVRVPAQSSVLEALESQGVPILASCRRGVCGSCEVRVLDGQPEHLDSVLDDDEKGELGVMYPCVSRAVGTRLALDV